VDDIGSRRSRGPATRRQCRFKPDCSCIELGWQTHSPDELLLELPWAEARPLGNGSIRARVATSQRDARSMPLTGRRPFKILPMHCSAAFIHDGKSAMESTAV